MDFLVNCCTYYATYEGELTIALLLAFVPTGVLFLSSMNVADLVHTVVNDKKLRRKYHGERLLYILVAISCAIFTNFAALPILSNRYVFDISREASITVLFAYVFGLVTLSYLEAHKAMVAYGFSCMPVLAALRPYMSGKDLCVASVLIIIATIAVLRLFWRRFGNPLAQLYFDAESVWDLRASVDLMVKQKTK